MNAEQPAIQARPGWVLAGGCALTFLASAVNTDFMIRIGVSVSHLTGDLSRITMETVRGGGHWSTDDAVLCCSLIGFVGGAGTSGFFIHHPTLELRHPYGRSIIAIGLLLMLCHFLAANSLLATCFLAAWACGMQNALATRYHGIVLRTTHITGLLTDLGQLLGMRLRGHHIEPWKISTPLLLSVTFASGAAMGALVNLKAHLPVTLICGSAYVLGGAVWSIVKRSGVFKRG